MWPSELIAILIGLLAGYFLTRLFLYWRRSRQIDRYVSARPAMTPDEREQARLRFRQLPKWEQLVWKIRAVSWWLWCRVFG